MSATLESTTASTTPPSPLKRPRVLAVVVTHNGRQWLKDCLVSLNAQSYPLLDVLVVDDASPDYRQPPHLKRVVKRHLRKLRWGFVRTPRPLGFGGAINWALARARTDAELLLFVHDDACLDRTSVEKMVARTQADPDTAIVGPKIVSWDDPTRLEEVGMAVDRFGYPYKGLEEGEIDIGQHDAPSEVFFVTSTCVLMRSQLFRQLKGWDASMRAYSEDLDLCWRAQVLGHTVRVEPEARVRHAMAMATGQRKSKFEPQRYFSRRNRLRAVTKNASSLRLIALLPQFVLLSFAEMLGFVVLRQPREIINLARALVWNVLRLPQTLAERTRVQLNRKVPDRSLRRLTIRETSRLRFYVTHKAGHLEEAWGRRAQFFAERGTEARALGQRLRGRPALLGAAALVAVLLAFRSYLWGPPASAGELLPFPDKATSLWQNFFSPWQAVGLGQPGPAPPALLPLGLFALLALGAAGAAQKLLLVTLAAAAFAGAYRLVSDLVDPVGRLAAGTVYVAGGVGYAGVGEGALGALVFGAAAPFALQSALRLAGWVRPSGWRPGRELARFTAAAAISAAFVPGSLIAYAVMAVVLSLTRAFVAPQTKALRALIASLFALLVAWVLLLPWSATWWGPGGPMERLTSDSTWRAHAATFADHGMGAALLGQVPDGPALYGLALPLLGLMAAIASDGQRRRVALALWAVVVTSGLTLTAIGAGRLRPFVASPTEAGVLPALAFSGLAGLAVGAFRMDLPRRGLGIIQGLAITMLAVSVFLLATGAGPAIWHGEWFPGRESRGESAEVIDQVRSVLDVEADQKGYFRALWVGEDWAPGRAGAARPQRSWLVTGPRGQVLTDLFERTTGSGEAELESVIKSVQEGATDRGGSLLAAFNVRYVAVQGGEDVERWLEQRDLGVFRGAAEDYVLLENKAQPASPGVYDRTPPYAQALAQDDPHLTADGAQVEREVAEQKSSSRYEIEDARGPGVFFLPETHDPRWKAAIGGTTLERIDGGWANAFQLPAAADGSLSVAYSRPPSQVFWLLATGLGWIVVLGAAFSSGRRARVGAPK